MLPLCSIITPTWKRNSLLLNRCIPSVDAQVYPNVEHLIISDGPDPELAEKMFPLQRAGQRSRWFLQLAEHDPAPHWGHLARSHGIELAAGELIGYVDDDDALRPQHVELLAAALAAHPEAGWACSVMASHRPPDGTVTEIGHGPPSAGNIGTPVIVHRREILEHGTWGPPSALEDWEMVNRWLHVGIPHVKVEEVTVDVWPSIYYGPGH
jgi:glycosyltransferase involved in cell wall biosynthesis